MWWLTVLLVFLTVSVTVSAGAAVSGSVGRWQVPSASSLDLATFQQKIQEIGHLFHGSAKFIQYDFEKRYEIKQGFQGK